MWATTKRALHSAQTRVSEEGVTTKAAADRPEGVARAFRGSARGVRMGSTSEGSVCVYAALAQNAQRISRSERGVRAQSMYRRGV